MKLLKPSWNMKRFESKRNITFKEGRQWLMEHKGNILSRKTDVECHHPTTPAHCPPLCVPRAEGPIVTVSSADVERPSSPYDNPDWLKRRRRRAGETERRQTERSRSPLPCPSFLHFCGASESLTPKTRKKKKNDIFRGNKKKNHFVSLTFVACFNFL